MNTVTLNTIGIPCKVRGGNGGGGGVTINNQEKSVDITENGTTEVVADAGFTGLSKVVVNTNVPTGGGGGTELEGEYFLVTPIEKYWKVRFINERDFIRDSLSEEQKEAFSALHMLIATYGIAYSTTKCSVNPPEWYDVQINNPMEASGNAGFGQARLYYDKIGQFEQVDNDFIRMFREAHIKSSETYLSVLGIYEYNLSTIMRLLLEESLGESLTDDEVNAMTSEMLLIDPITKEEYESTRLE